MEENKTSLGVPLPAAKKEIKKSKKRKWIEVGIAVSVIVIAIALYFSSKGFNSSSGGSSYSIDKFSFELSKQVADILKDVQGVGKVKVTLTFEDDGETFYEKNTENTSNSVTQDGKTTENSTEKTTIVMVQGKPIVIKKNMPKVRGVVVVAEGASDSQVKYIIIETVKTLLSVKSDVIEVFQMRS